MSSVSGLETYRAVFYKSTVLIEEAEKELHTFLVLWNLPLLNCCCFIFFYLYAVLGYHLSKIFNGIEEKSTFRQFVVYKCAIWDARWQEIKVFIEYVVHNWHN